MAALALQLLTLAMSLIMAVKNNPAAPAAQRAQAIAAANYAIQVANQTLAALKGGAASVPSSSPTSTSPLPPATPTAATSSLSIAVNTAVGALRLTPGTRNQVIGSYLFSAAGPSTINITTTTITLGTKAASTFSNIKLFVNNLQVGDTIASPTSSDALAFAGRFYPIAVSPGNPARADIFADIGLGGGGMNPATTITGCNAFIGATTSTLPCPAVPGQGVTVGLPSLGAIQNPAANFAPLVKSRAGQRIGSYVLTASNAEDVRVNNLTLVMGSSPDIANVSVNVNGVQFGITQTPGPGGSLFLGGTPFVISAGSNATILDVYADILGTPSNMSPATAITGCGAVGVSSGISATCGYAPGQGIAIAQ